MIFYEKDIYMYYMWICVCGGVEICTSYAMATFCFDIGPKNCFIYRVMRMILNNIIHFPEPDVEV